MEMPITFRELRQALEQLTEKAINALDNAEADDCQRLSQLWNSLEDRILSGEQIFERPE